MRVGTEVRSSENTGNIPSFSQSVRDPHEGHFQYLLSIHPLGNNAAPSIREIVRYRPRRRFCPISRSRSRPGDEAQPSCHLQQNRLCNQSCSARTYVIQNPERPHRTWRKCNIDRADGGVEAVGVAADAKLTRGRQLKIDPPRRGVLPSGGPHVGSGGSGGDLGLETAGKEHSRDRAIRKYRRTVLRETSSIIAITAPSLTSHIITGSCRAWAGLIGRRPRARLGASSAICARAFTSRWPASSVPRDSKLIVIRLMYELEPGCARSLMRGCMRPPVKSRWRASRCLRHGPG